MFTFEKLKKKSHDIEAAINISERLWPHCVQFFFSSFYLEEHEGHLAPVTFPTKQTEIEQGKKLALENI